MPGRSASITSAAQEAGRTLPDSKGPCLEGWITLTALAQDFSEDMAARDYMAHDNPDGEGPGDRARRHGYSSWGAENVAKGQSSAEQVMEAWMNSPGHRANILNCDLTAIGVGEASNAWTQKFGYE